MCMKKRRNQLDAEPLGQPVAVDQIDIRILSILQRDGRISKTALAEMVCLSPSACLDRMRRLERKKLIQSYHAHLNFKALFGVTHFFTTIMLRTHRQSDFSMFEQYVRKVDEVVECHALGGGIDYLLKLVSPNVEHYQAVIDRMLDANVGVDRYFTYIVTKPVKTQHQMSVDSLLKTVRRAE